MMQNHTQIDSEIECFAPDRDTDDQAWIISAALIILSMQAGFALLESGSISHINSSNILFKNLADMCVGGLSFYCVGYGIAFGKQPGELENPYFGTGEFFPDANTDFVLWFFHFSFAATAATITSGIVVERINIKLYLLLSACVTGFIYPVVVHAVWSPNGFLAKAGFLDFAGSGVVHFSGGTVALVATTHLGPRLGVLGRRPKTEFPLSEEVMNLPRKVFKGETVNLLFGTLLLWFAWYAFNSGSTMQITNGGDIAAGRILFTTTLIPCTAAITSLILSNRMTSFSLIEYFCMCILGGLVISSSCANSINGLDSIVLGVLGAIISIASKFLIVRLQIDDPVDVLPVHFFCGFLGCLSPALFSHAVDCEDESKNVGLFYGGGFHQLGVQLYGAGCIFVWTAITVKLFLIFFEKVLRISVRIGEMEEFLGLDLCEHGLDHYERISLVDKLRKCMEDPKNANVLKTFLRQNIEERGIKSKFSFHRKASFFVVPDEIAQDSSKMLGLDNHIIAFNADDN